MKQLSFAAAIDDALAFAMKKDERVVVFGEDVCTLRRNLFAQFGPSRVFNTPISESAFLGAAVTAAMGGLLPVVEIMLIDFIGVCMDGLLNQAAKIDFFTNGKWKVPLVIRASCGGGYGDAGQHEQSLWGWLAHIPGLSVTVPSTPKDAGLLMYQSIFRNSPVIYLEHKLLSDYWLEYLGGSKRTSVHFNVPEKGIFGEVPENWSQDNFGKANIVKQGTDITFISIGIGVHQCLEVAKELSHVGINAEVIDLRYISPLDISVIIKSVKKTERCVVVDEDYRTFGLSGEITAVLKESNVNFTYRRVCTSTTIPYNRMLEDTTLPNFATILNKAKELCS